MIVNAQNEELPILIVEAGMEIVITEGEHKDSSKKYGLLVWSRFNFAYALAHSRMRPKLGITYGMLIGKSKRQLLVPSLCYAKL